MGVRKGTLQILDLDIYLVIYVLIHSQKNAEGIYKAPMYQAAECPRKYKCNKIDEP